MRRSVFVLALLLTCGTLARADDGYELWLRYRPIADPARSAEYRTGLTHLVMSGSSPTLSVARDELTTGLRSLLGSGIPSESRVRRDGALVVGTPASSRIVAGLLLAGELRALGPDGFIIRDMRIGGRRVTVIAAKAPVRRPARRPAVKPAPAAPRSIA